MQNSQGRVVRVQKLPKPIVELNPEELDFEFCLFYPQYRFFEARKMSHAKKMRAVKFARKSYLYKKLDEAQIAMSSLVGDKSKKPYGLEVISDIKKRIKEIDG